MVVTGNLPENPARLSSIGSILAAPDIMTGEVCRPLMPSWTFSQTYQLGLVNFAIWCASGK
jgi:hypothetical protein